MNFLKKLIIFILIYKKKIKKKFLDMLKVETKLMHTPIIGQVNVLYF
jgi:hypothetical protein